MSIRVMVVSSAAREERVMGGSYVQSKTHHQTCVVEQCWGGDVWLACAIGKLGSLTGRNQQRSLYEILSADFDESVVGFQLRNGKLGVHYHQKVTGARCVSFGPDPTNNKDTNLSFLTLSRALHSVSTLDYIGLEAYRSRSTMQLEEKATSVA